VESRKGSKLVTLDRLFHLHRGTLCNRVKSICQSKKTQTDSTSPDKEGRGLEHEGGSKDGV